MPKSIEHILQEKFDAITLVGKANLEKSWLTHEYLFIEFEIKTCIVHYWERCHSHVVKLIDERLIQRLTRERRPKSKVKLG